jgi:hypothetical protein
VIIATSAGGDSFDVDLGPQIPTIVTVYSVSALKVVKNTLVGATPYSFLASTTRVSVVPP